MAKFFLFPLCESLSEDPVCEFDAYSARIGGTPAFNFYERDNFENGIFVLFKRLSLIAFMGVCSVLSWNI